MSSKTIPIEKRKDFKCPLCSKKFKSERQTILHLVVDHDKDYDLDTAKLDNIILALKQIGAHKDG